jgi:hypothetical protein
MQLIIRVLLVSIILFPLVSCGRKGEIDTQYKLLSSKSLAEINKDVCEYIPSKRVDIYLYGVENFRPSDYSLLPGECLDDAVVVDMVERLRKSSNGTRTFALIYALRVASGKKKISVGTPIRAVNECSRYFPVNSPCHEMAKKIDGFTD